MVSGALSQSAMDLQGMAKEKGLQVTFQQSQTSAEPTAGQFNPAGTPRSVPVVGLQVDHGKCKGGTWTCHVHVDGVSFLGKHREHFPQVHLEGNEAPKVTETPPRLPR